MNLTKSMRRQYGIYKTCQTIDTACTIFCLPTGDKCKPASTRCLEYVLTGCVLTAMSMIGLTLLGWSSFEFDTNG